MNDLVGCFSVVVLVFFGVCLVLVVVRLGTIADLLSRALELMVLDRALERPDEPPPVATPLPPIYCPQCEAENTTTARYCVACQHQLAPVPAN